MHRERRKSQLGFGGFCFVFKISALTIINILGTTKADSVLQLRCLSWVKFQATEHRVFGVLQAHSVTQHFRPIKLLVVTLWSNSQQGWGLEPFYSCTATLRQVNFVEKQSAENSRSIHLQLNKLQGMNSTQVPTPFSQCDWCQTMCLIGFLCRNADESGLSGNVTLHRHTEVQITCKVMQSKAGLKKCFQNKSVARNTF